MPRSGSGSYTLPTGNPVVSGTTIEASWANNTLNDVATTLTDSLSRSGQGGMTAAFRAADGSASVPGVAWSSETGTGFYRAGSGDTRFVVSTTEVQKWLSTGTAITGTLSATGNLSTGTASPVFGSGSGVEIERAGIATLRLENSSASNSFELYADSAANGINLRGRDSSPMNFWTGNTLQATLDASGNLGIGTTTINYRVVADCAGVANNNAGIAVRNTNASAYGGSYNFEHLVTGGGAVVRASYISSEGGGGGSFLRFATTNAGTLTEQMRLDASGNLGIGTGSPIGRLAVVGTAVGAGVFSVDTDATRVDIQSYNKPLAINRQGNDTLFNEGGGNLGIGTSSPGAKLDVNGNSRLSNGTGFTTANSLIRQVEGVAGAANQFTVGSIGFFTGAFSDQGQIVFSTNNSLGNTERMRLDSSGNLGLGVTPSAWSGLTALQIAGSGAIAGNNQYLEIETNTYYNAGYKYIGTGLAAKYGQEAGKHIWYTAPSGTAGDAISFTQAMTLSASGQLGIGTTNPGRMLHVKSSTGSMTLEGTSVGGYIEIIGPTTTNYIGTPAAISSGSTTDLGFYLNGSERARITSGGDLLVGTTSVGAGIGATFRQTVESGGDGIAIKAGAAAANLPLACFNPATTGDNSFVSFYTETSPTPRGSIDYNRAGGLTRYNTTSDYRAKDIIGPVQNPGATIDALKVYEGVMKGATQSRPMLVAHEAQEHAPYAVSGVKDEVNEDGTPKFQQMDVSSLVPLLLAEIQSLRARVAALEAA